MTISRTQTIKNPDPTYLKNRKSQQAQDERRMETAEVEFRSLLQDRKTFLYDDIIGQNVSKMVRGRENRAFFFLEEVKIEHLSDRTSRGANAFDGGTDSITQAFEVFFFWFGCCCCSGEFPDRNRNVA
jgi:hypothetical protein